MAKEVIDLWARETFVYRLFGTRGELVYVGISDRWRNRLDGHRKNSEWWGYVVRAVIERYETRHQAFAVESWAIKYESPIWNNESQWRGVPFIVPKPLEAFSREVVHRTWSGDEIPAKEMPNGE